MYDYWHKQTLKRPLFPDIEWSRPEQKALAGRLLIVGGNTQGLAAPIQAYEATKQMGIGECRVALPDATKQLVSASAIDCVFVSSTKAGGISKEALQDLRAYTAWANGLLYIGDTGRNAETAMVLEQSLGYAMPTVLTRDALDLVRGQASQWLQSPELCVAATFAQLQKIFQAVHYPKMLLFSMQLAQLVETLHKFTVTYPCQIITLHQQQLIVAYDGKVSTTPCTDNLVLWRGIVASTSIVYLIQHPQKPFEALTTAIHKSTTTSSGSTMTAFRSA
jgi:hypothetical protein